MGDTQEELAGRLEVDRATVNRWENSTEAISGTQAYAIRSHVFFRLGGKSTVVDSVAETFLVSTPMKPSKRAPYQIDAATMAAA